MNNQLELDADGFSRASLKVLRLPQVIEKVGLSRSTIYAHIKGGSFPRQCKLGARSVGWLEHHVDGWLSNRVQDVTNGGAK